MKITFEPKDKPLFFNMISAYKIFGELSEKINDLKIDIPYSSIDVIIAKLSEIVMNFKFYKISFQEDEEKIRRMVAFMLGTGIWTFAANNDLWSLFIKEAIPNAFLEISKDELFDWLLKNNLEL
jgi:hypothetical protein